MANQEAFNPSTQAVKDATEHKSSPVEYGWLIEHEQSSLSSPLYFAPDNGCGGNWSFNPLVAVRFARKQDAEAVASMVAQHGERHRCCEHSWG